MARLIDADKLAERVANLEAVAIEQVLKYEPCDEKWKVWSAILNERTAFKFDLFDAPTVEAEPIRHGHWEYKHLWKGVEAKYCECSACHHPAWWPTDYCPNCGAKMDEVET